MQAMTMNVAGLGLGVRARATARPRANLASKVVLTGTPLVGKSVTGFAPRRSVGMSVEARNIRRQMTSTDADGPVPEPKVEEPEVVAAAEVVTAVEEPAPAATGPPPVVEAPFVGITKDIKARGPLYINDFVQGISFKSVVSVFIVSLNTFLLRYFLSSRPPVASSGMSTRRARSKHA